MTAVRILLLATVLGLCLLLPLAGNPIAATVLWVFCLFILARSHPHGMLSFACLYLLLLGVFHLGMVGPIALGITGAHPPPWATSRWLPSAVELVSVAIVAFTLGARLRSVPRTQRDAPLPPQQWLFLVGLLVALLSATILWVEALRTGVLAGGYAEYYRRALTEDFRLFRLGLLVFPMGVVIAAVGASPRMLAAVGVLVAVVLGPLFLGGFRGPVIVQVASLLAVWAHKDARVARRVGAGIAIATIVLVPAVRMTRDVRRDVTEGIGTLDPLAVLLEAGGSLYPVVVTTDRIQSGAEPLWFGRSYAMGLRRILPNLGRRAEQNRALGPDGWATLHANRWLFDRGGGIGYSGVAEPYLNFGTAGVVLVFFLLGLVVQQWEHWLARDPFRAAIGAATFGFVLWTVRNEATELFRSIAIVSAIVATSWMAHRLLGARRRAASRAEPARAA